MTYEEYQEQVFFAITTDWPGYSVEELEAEYPEHAARAKAEADARRGETYEAYQERCASYPDVVLVENQDGDVEYVTVER